MRYFSKKIVLHLIDNLPGTMRSMVEGFPPNCTLHIANLTISLNQPRCDKLLAISC